MLRHWWPRRVGPGEPLAAALQDHYATGRARRVAATRADGVCFTIDTREYFTLDGELALLDTVAMDRCQGRVLDVGAGAGRHALALQSRGHEVVAIDISSVCTELCRARGVEDARTVDVMSIDADAPLGMFDTIFFGMQTIGVAGGVEPLGRMLARIKNSLAPGGIMLVDSSALREAWEGDALDASPRAGEIVLSTRYRGQFGEPFPWLYIGAEHLEEIASGAGLETEILETVDGGEFLAALRRNPDDPISD